MKKTNRYVLSLDFGTTAIKVGLFTLKGDLFRIETREQPLLFPDSGRIEQSPQLIWETMTATVRHLMEDVKPSAIDGISLSIQRGTVVPINNDGIPVTNQIVWMDGRGLPYLKYIENLIKPDEYYSISGHNISHIPGISKIIWLQKEADDIWQKTRVVAPPQTHILKRLGCEDFVCDLSTGTYLFPFDIKKKVWSDDLSRIFDIPMEKLPKLVTAVDIVGQLSREASTEMGLQQGIPIVAGGGDGQCAAVGSGITETGLCMINIGTATGVQVYLPEPILDPACVLSCSGHVIPESWEMEGHTQASGAVLRWFRDEFGTSEMALSKRLGLDEYDVLIKQATLAEPGSNGLLFIPTFNGSKAPYLEPYANGVLFGLNLSHQKKHIIRAILEGISLEIRWMLDAVKEVCGPIKEIRLAGGGSRNKYWNQIHADILGQPLTLIDTPDAALVGAAICAVVGIGVYPSFEEAAKNFVKPTQKIEPQLINQAVYQTAYNNFRSLFITLSKTGVFMLTRNQ